MLNSVVVGIIRISTASHIIRTSPVPVGGALLASTSTNVLHKSSPTKGVASRDQREEGVPREPCRTDVLPHPVLVKCHNCEAFSRPVGRLHERLALSNIQEKGWSSVWT